MVIYNYKEGENFLRKGNIKMKNEMATMIQNVTEIITGFDAQISPVKMQIGYVDEKNICHEGLLILDAPAIVVEHIVNQGYHCSMRNGALFVNNYKPYE